MKTGQRYAFAAYCVVVGIIIAIALGGCIEGTPLCVEMTSPITPDNTKVVLHFMDGYNQNSFALSSGSWISYYKDNGDLLGIYKDEEVVNGNFMARYEDSLFYFYKNRTIMADNFSAVTYENSSGIDIQNAVFAPSEIGVIEEMDMAYGLFNVGIQTEGSDYLNIIRFVSSSQNYDVVIPYFLGDISYDAVSRKFICMVDEVNFLYSSEIPAGPVYVQLVYDEGSGCFQYDQVLHELPVGSLYDTEDVFSRNILAKDGMLYAVVIADTKASSEDNVKVIYLDTYDLKDLSLVSQAVLLDCYDAGRFGHGAMTGIATSPKMEINGNLYIFTSAEQVVIINDKGVIYRDMPFVFSDALDRWNINSNSTRGDFFGSSVTIGNDGQIYVLNMYSNNRIKIHMLNKNGTFELIWQGQRPSSIPQGATISSFEIIN